MLLDPPLIVFAAFDLLHPGRIVQIPLYGFSYSGFKGFIRRPAQFFFEFAEIDRVTQIMAGSVFDKSDQIPAGGPIGSGLHVIHQITNHVDGINNGKLTATASA